MPYDFLLFEGVIFGSLGLFIGFTVVCSHRHRVMVTVMRRCGIHIYPEAIAIATLIMEHPEQWSADAYRLHHPVIGAIWIANEAHGIKVETPMGEWRPNAYERLIIRDAVDWRLHQYIRHRINLALQKNGNLPLPGHHLT